MDSMVLHARAFRGAAPPPCRCVSVPAPVWGRSFLPVCRQQHLEFLASRSLRANPHLQQHSHIRGAPKEIASCIAITRCYLLGRTTDMTVLLQMWVGPQRPRRQEFQMLLPANGQKTSAPNRGGYAHATTGGWGGAAKRPRVQDH